MNGIPNSTWQKNTDEAVFNIPANNSLICNITDKVMFAYSLRLVNANYNGALIRVRRSRDNAELDIYADQFGKLDIKTLQDFCPTGNAFVTRWYDQSGFARNAFQGTANSQPIIILNGVLYTINGVPSLNMNSNRFLTHTTTAFDWSMTMSLVTVNYQNQSGTKNVCQFLTSLGASNNLAISTQNFISPTGNIATTSPSFRSRYTVNGGATADVQAFLLRSNPLLYMFYWAGSNTINFINGLGNGFDSGSGSIPAFPSSSLSISSNIFGLGFTSELIIFDGQIHLQSETYINIIKNVGKYYSIGLPI
jgi:hypothetical protein